MAAGPRPVVLVVERNLKRFLEIDFDVVVQQYEKHHLFFVEQCNLNEDHDPYIRITKEAHMAKESSFDIVSTVDIQEVDNAFQQAKREISQRYDLKDSGAEIMLDKQNKTLGIHAPADFVARQVKDVIGSKLVKRGIELTAVKWGEPQAATGQSVRLSATIVDGIDKETASKISKDIRNLKLKCKTTIEGDKLRVSSASRDTLQEVIAFLKGQDYGQPLQYTNYR